jgi:hypothetical protein
MAEEEGLAGTPDPGGAGETLWRDPARLADVPGDVLADGAGLGGTAATRRPAEGGLTGAAEGFLGRAPDFREAAFPFLGEGGGAMGAGRDGLAEESTAGGEGESFLPGAGRMTGSGANGVARGPVPGEAEATCLADSLEIPGEGGGDLGKKPGFPITA